MPSRWRKGPPTPLARTRSAMVRRRKSTNRSGASQSSWMSSRLRHAAIKAKQDRVCPLKCGYCRLENASALERCFAYLLVSSVGVVLMLVQKLPRAREPRRNGGPVCKIILKSGWSRSLAHRARYPSEPDHRCHQRSQERLEIRLALHALPCSSFAG